MSTVSVTVFRLFVATPSLGLGGLAPTGAASTTTTDGKSMYNIYYYDKQRISALQLKDKIKLIS